MNQHPNMQTLKTMSAWVDVSHKFISVMEKPKQNFVWFAEDETISALAQTIFIAHAASKFKFGIVVVDLISQAIEFKAILDHVCNSIDDKAKNIHSEILLSEEYQVCENTGQVNILIVPSFRLNTLFTNEICTKNNIDFINFHHIENLLDSNLIIEQIKSTLIKKTAVFFRLTHKKRDVLQKIASFFNGVELIHPALLEKTVHATAKAANVPLPVFPPEPCVIISNHAQKRNIIQHLLINFDWQKIVIVTKTKHTAHRIEEKLYRRKIRSKIIHATLPEEVQNHFVQKLANQEIRVLFISGASFNHLNYPELDAVFFYDPPEHEHEFSERLQFFANYQKNLVSLSLISDEELPALEAIEANTAKVYPRVEVTLLQTHKTVQQSEAKKEDHSADKQTNNSDDRNRAAHTKRNNKKKPIVSADKANNQKVNRYGSSDNNAIKRGNSTNVNNRKKSRNVANNGNSIGNSEQQGIVNQNRLPFELDSFEANISRENKRRVRSLFSKQASIDKAPTTSSFEPNLRKVSPSKVKIVHRKRKSIELDDIGNN